MNAEHLRTIGAALYGRQWQTDLAQALDVDARTVRRWASGESIIPKGLASDLNALCQIRMAEIAAAREGLRPGL